MLRDFHVPSQEARSRCVGAWSIQACMYTIECFAEDFAVVVLCEKLGSYDRCQRAESFRGMTVAFAVSLLGW